MSDEKRKQAERNAGAFLGPDVLAPVPMRTLSDDYRDVPVDPPDDRVPEPEAPGFIRRIADRFKQGSKPAR